MATPARSGKRWASAVTDGAPLQQYLEAGISQFEIEQPDFKAFLTTYQDGRWVLMFPDDEVERDEDALRALVTRAIGRSDVDIEIITTGRWELSALIADTFSSGRVFLAGDAAHTLPPARGGYGANTGIEDAYNLAWKLQSVLSGKSEPRLLDTYDAERRPIAWLRHRQIFARPDYAKEAPPGAAQVPIIDDEAMEFGQLYRSGAILGAGYDLPPALRPEQWIGQPGTRAPHLWVTANGKRVSTLDLLQRGWVLLAEDERWCTAATQAGEAMGIQLESLRVGAAVLPSDPEAFRKAFGLTPSGATLIRPDGYIAWRSRGMPANPGRALTEALGQVSFAQSHPSRTAPIATARVPA
jgi:hypothetical protein